jgi:hypothetical protein
VQSPDLALALWFYALAGGLAVPLGAGADRLDPPALPLPGWPGVLSVAATAMLVLVMLTIVAAGTGGDLHRRITSIPTSRSQRT